MRIFAGAALVVRLRERFQIRAQFLDVPGAPHERERQIVQLQFQGRRGVRAILFRHRGEAERHSWQVDALVGTELAPHLDPTAGCRRRHREHFQLQRPVVQQNVIPHPQVEDNIGVRERDFVSRVGDGTRGQHDLMSLFEPHTVFGQGAHPDFGPLQVPHQRHEALLLPRHAPNQLRHLAGALGIAVREIQTGDGHPRADHGANHFRRFRCRT